MWTDFGGSQFPNDDARGGPRNYSFTPFKRLTRLLAREYFIEDSNYVSVE